MLKNCVVVNVTRLLLQPRLAGVGYGLVERLEIFECGLGLVRRARAEVFVESPVGRVPSVGVLPAQLPGEVFAQQRMRIERDERAGRVSVHCEQFCGFESRERDVALCFVQRGQWFGEIWNRLTVPECAETIGSRGPVE